MKVAVLTLTASLALALTGCVLRGKPQTVQAAPAAPKPTVAPAPEKPAEPLSIPQTRVELTAPQPISTEALATTLPAEEPAPAPATPKPVRAGPRPTAAHTEPPAQPPNPTPNEPTERPPVQELLSADEQRQFLMDMQRSRQEAKQSLDRTSGRRLNRQSQQLKQRVEGFLTLSDDAEKRGDLRQARELAGRAAVLARELQP